MGLFGNKFKKLKRDDVVNAIVDLQSELDSLDSKVINHKQEVEQLMAEGIKQTDRDVQFLIAKKIETKNKQKKTMIDRCLFLMYNINMLEKLKDSIDDNEFFAKNLKGNLNTLLADQKGLAKFLNQALNTRVRAEDVLTNADETFNEVASMYEKNNDIYGESENANSIMAIFENANAVGVENNSVFNIDNTTNEKENQQIC